MNDLETRLSAALRTQLDQLEMPNRLPLIGPRARRQRRLRSLAMVAALIVGVVGISFGVLFGAARLLDRNTQQPAMPKRERTLPLPGHPTSIVSGAHAIWISTYIERAGHQFGQVTRIDPASGHVWRYDLGAVVGGMQITAGPEGVFVVENANRGTIAQLDPNSPTVIRHSSGRNLEGILVGGGSLWAGSCSGSVIRIDPSTLRETATIPVIASPGSGVFKCANPMLFAQHGLWFLTGPHRLSRLDPKTQTITQSVHVPFAYTEGSSQNVASSPGRIWATYSNELDGRVRIAGADTRTGRVVVSRRVGRAVSFSNDLTALHGQIRAIAANRHYLWLAVPGRVLWLDPSTLHAVRTTRVTDPTGLAVVGDSLWVVEGRQSGQGAVQRISISGRDRRPSTTADEPGGQLLLDLRSSAAVEDPGAAPTSYGSDLDPYEFSADGRSVLAAVTAAVPSGLTLNRQLVSLSASSGQTTVLVDAGSKESLGPASWSPDGGAIAYIKTTWDSDPSQGNPGKPASQVLCWLQVASSHEKCFESLPTVVAIDWAYDSTHVIVTGFGSDPVTLVDVETGASSELLPAGGDNTTRAALEAKGYGQVDEFSDPQWSSSGSYFALEALVTPGGAVPLVFDKAGSFVSMGRANDDSIVQAWSPIRDELAYTMGFAGTGPAQSPFGVRILDPLKDSDVTLASTADEDHPFIMSLAWDPTGRWIAAGNQYHVTIIDSTSGAVASRQSLPDQVIADPVRDWRT